MSVLSCFVGLVYFLCRRSDQQAAEDLVRGETPAWGQIYAVGVQLEQAGIADLKQRGHGVVENCLAELQTQMAEIDALIQTQSKEERFFEGFVASKDIDLVRGNTRLGFKETKGSHFGCVAEVLVQIAGVGKSYSVRACGQHGVGIQPEALRTAHASNI